MTEERSRIIHDLTITGLLSAVDTFSDGIYKARQEGIGGSMVDRNCLKEALIRLGYRVALFKNTLIASPMAAVIVKHEDITSYLVLPEKVVVELKNGKVIFEKEGNVSISKRE